MANLLSIIQDAADEIGLPRPSTVVGSSDSQVRQLLRVANQEGVELARRHDWQALTKEKSWTAAATEAQTGVMPSDFDRFIGGTFYNRGRTRLVAGPLTPQEWQDYKSRLASIVYDAFRLKGDTLYLLPEPSGSDTYVFEYVSKWWCSPASGTTPTQDAWTADTDVPYLPADLLTLGTMWRYKAARGLDYGQTFQDYELQLARITGREGGKRTLSMGSGESRRHPRPPQAPDGNWNMN